MIKDQVVVDIGKGLKNQAQQFLHAVQDMPFDPPSVYRSEAFCMASLFKLLGVRAVFDFGTGHEVNSCRAFARFLPEATVYTVERFGLPIVSKRRLEVLDKVRECGNIVMIEKDAENLVQQLQPLAFESPVGCFFDGPKGPQAVKMLNVLIAREFDIAVAGFHDCGATSKPTRNCHDEMVQAVDWFTDEGWFREEFDWMDTKRHPTYPYGPGVGVKLFRPWRTSC